MIDIPTDYSVRKLADWVELYICFHATGVSKADLTNILEDELGSIEESTVDAIGAELERRCNLYEGAVPFYLDGDNFVIAADFDWRTFPEHIMCLIYSIRGVVSNPDPGTKLFERLSSQALQKYLNGKVMQFGFPLGLSFKRTLEALAIASHERRGFDPHPDDKDKKVDTVGWIPHGDRRSAQVVVLMQSGAGKLWYDKERIPVDTWQQKLILWEPVPIPALAIPELIEEDRWSRITEKFKLVLDRARLLRHTAALDTPDATLRQEIANWCDTQLSTAA